MHSARTADGLNLSYSIQGSGDPLLLISGQGQDHQMWRTLAPLLAREYRVLCYDHRGTGQSDKPREPAYTTEMLADDAIAILNAADIPRAHVFGLSMGGRIGQWLGIRYPHRLGCLILGATTPGDGHGIPRSEEVTRQMLSNDPKLLYRLLYNQAYIDRGGELMPFADTPAFAKRLHFVASETHDAWTQLATISTPTLILHGSSDQINPTANAHILTAAIPRATMAIIEGARHGFIDEYREETLRIIREFTLLHPVHAEAGIPLPTRF